MWNREGGYDVDFGRRARRGYGGDFDRGAYGYGGRGYESQRPRPSREGYGRDYWWLGEHELRRRGQLGGYDAGYQRFDERTHPRFSPVGGMYPPVGGGYYSRHAPRPLRENMWFSDWTRWF